MLMHILFESPVILLVWSYCAGPVFQELIYACSSKSSFVITMFDA